MTDREKYDEVTVPPPGPLSERAAFACIEAQRAFFDLGLISHALDSRSDSRFHVSDVPPEICEKLKMIAHECEQLIMDPAFSSSHTLRE